MEHLVSRQAPPGVNPLDLPAVPPPPGVVPNLANPEWQGMTTIIVTAIFLSIALTAFSIRLFTRIHVVRGFGKDDGTLMSTQSIAVDLNCEADSACSGLDHRHSMSPQSLEAQFALTWMLS